MLLSLFDCARAEPKKPPEAPSTSKSRRFMSSLPCAPVQPRGTPGTRARILNCTASRLSDFRTIRFQPAERARHTDGAQLRAPAGFAFPMRRAEVQALRITQMFDKRLQSLRCDHPTGLIELGVHHKEAPQCLQATEDETLLPVEKSQSKHVPIQVVRESSKVGRESGIYLGFDPVVDDLPPGHLAAQCMLRYPHLQFAVEQVDHPAARILFVLGPPTTHVT